MTDTPVTPRQGPGAVGPRRRARLTTSGDALGSVRIADRSLSGPVRTCVGCRARASRAVLLRVVAAEVDGVWCVVPDPDCRRVGRGAWLHHDPACLELAERRKAFPRALRRGGPLESGALRGFVGRSAVSPLESSTSTVRAGSGSEADEHPMSTQR